MKTLILTSGLLLCTTVSLGFPIRDGEQDLRPDGRCLHNGVEYTMIQPPAIVTNCPEPPNSGQPLHKQGQSGQLAPTHTAEDCVVIVQPVPPDND
ncbi:hypothetical protein [Marinicella meishanensis]|uniref:hypothetical protein n=1 Tax=Marinicella meishanensis TaxID=2873263 RepID=UPI001CBD34BF|nr:hypothetical protein [Marinicella sp. NBU2979]